MKDDGANRCMVNSPAGAKIGANDLDRPKSDKHELQPHDCQVVPYPTNLKGGCCSK